jgi:BlaI family penicillinase repressor
MPKIPEISDAEWDVMCVVWDHGPLTAGEVVRRLATARDWHPRTVKTLLARLVKKGAVRANADPDGGAGYLYRAAVARDAAVRRESRSFLSRVFGGAVAPAVVHFLENARLTPAELELL